jgi:hypothetical protein
MMVVLLQSNIAAVGLILEGSLDMKRISDGGTFHTDTEVN